MANLVSPVVPLMPSSMESQVRGLINGGECIGGGISEGYVEEIGGKMEE